MSPENKHPEVIIVGCGVSGLTCGIRLRERGLKANIFARERPPHTTSDTAAAVWYPYKVEPDAQVRKWADVTFKEFYCLSNVAASGVSLVQFVQLFDHPQADPWWKSVVRKFQHTPQEELPRDLGYQDGYTIETPLIETSVYLNYLMTRFYGLGGQIQKREIAALNDLCRDNRLIINCTGVWARTLSEDPHLSPLRGQILRVTKLPTIRRCLLDEDGPLGLTYIVPRSNDCILGGTAESNRWSLEPDFDISQEILRKCIQLEPSLQDAAVLEQKVGLRPAHKNGVQLKLEPIQEFAQCAIIHNYGHGGSGFTLSWGCADEVADQAVAFLEKSV